MKGCSIMIEIIGKHPQFKEAKKDPVYLKLKARTNDDILGLLEDITVKLRDEQEINEAMERYPPVEAITESPTYHGTDILLNNVPSIPTHVPAANKKQLSPSPSPSPSPSQSPPQVINETIGGIQLPMPSKSFNLSPTFIVDPKQLASWIVKRNNGQEQPSVLILDIRPRHIFSQGSIKHKWIAQIEPLTLKPNVLSGKIEETMMMNPEAEQTIFAARHRFDLVVYYDQSSSDIGHCSDSLKYLRESIYEMEFQKVLQRAPILLGGGFNAWSSVIGEKGIYRYSNNIQPNNQLDDIQLTPIKVHHTVYDYFSSSTTAKPKESMGHTSNPPLRGIFGTNTNLFEPTTPPYQMPIPQMLTRKKTFIDNPFHGFTSTTNEQFDLPPQPLRPSIIPSRSSSKPMMGMAGLTNLGNTCFMNSILQCLSGTLPFVRYFLSGNYKRQGRHTDLAQAFTDLLRQMRSRVQKETVTTKLFHNALSQFDSEWTDFKQHDSQEFMIFLLSNLHEECKDEATKVPTWEQLDEKYGDGWLEKMPDWQANAWSWERSLALNSSVIVSLFQGQYRSRLRCLTCGTQSTTYNDFMSLVVPIAHLRTPTLYDCLDEFVKVETLQGTDRWRCPRCKELRVATKQLTLSRLPDVLLVTLQRFRDNGHFVDKLDNFVDYPITGLDMSKFVPPTMFPPTKPPEQSAFQYNLYAVSNHMGTLNGGHYTALVKNGTDWYEFNDTQIQKIEESKVVTKAGYNLFYVRSTVK
ncbi:MAG: hypothetical protein EXX96DRAFT_592521 [Benjaminiella poitrasii]|nr:MAG: hypothetical protein EXX96DRAFT_592521 [Benjaminiella poitrasii]